MITEPITYKFSTFQEMFERVPANRICDCLDEIGRALSSAKATGELLYETAKFLAKEDGRELPPMPAQLFQLPPEMEWIDDGKGEVGATLTGPDGRELMTVEVNKNQ